MLHDLLEIESLIRTVPSLAWHRPNLLCDKHARCYASRFINECMMGFVILLPVDSFWSRISHGSLCPGVFSGLLGSSSPANIVEY